MEKVDKIIYFFHGFTNFFLAHNITGNSKVVQNHFLLHQATDFWVRLGANCEFDPLLANL